MKRKITPTPLTQSKCCIIDDDVPFPVMKYNEMFRQSYDEIRLLLNYRDVTVRPSLIANAGDGLFAMREFSPKDPITSYEGNVLSADEIGSLSTSHMKGFGTRTTDWVIDGLRKISDGQGSASMANHNRILANAEFDHVDTQEFYEKQVIPWMSTFSCQKFPNPSGHRLLFLRATKTIHIGEEIYVNYGGRDFCARHGIPY